MNPEEVLVKALRMRGQLGVSEAGGLLQDAGWVPRGPDPITYIEPSRRAAKKALNRLVAAGLVAVGWREWESHRSGGWEKAYHWLGERDEPAEPLPLIPVRRG